MNNITKLLTKLKERNDANTFRGVLKRRISSPAPLAPVATLDPQHSRKLTPMLTARFEFAGEWQNAAASQTWLSLRQMAEAPRTSTIAKQLAFRFENWPTSAVAKRARHAVSLFGLDQEEFEETYLLWHNGEPQIATYIGNEEQVFEDLEQYLIFLTTD